MLHLLLHVLVPLGVAATAFRTRVWRAFGLMMFGMVIDIDHLLATPVYAAERCSIGFHPLHTVMPVAIYIALLVPPKTRLVGLGLCIHIALDALDCWGIP